MTTGRTLTDEEILWLNERGLLGSFDVDTCEPQLTHIVMQYDPHGEKFEALCKSGTLWSTGLPWTGGCMVQEHLSCERCLARFEELRSFPMDRKIGQPRHEQLKLCSDIFREFGRPDLAMLMDAIRVSWFVQTPVDGSVIRWMMKNILSLKQRDIAKAIEALEAADERGA